MFPFYLKLGKKRNHVFRAMKLKWVGLEVMRNSLSVKNNELPSLEHLFVNHAFWFLMRQQAHWMREPNRWYRYQIIIPKIFFRWLFIASYKFFWICLKNLFFRKYSNSFFCHQLRSFMMHFKLLVRNVVVSQYNIGLEGHATKINKTNFSFLSIFMPNFLAIIYSTKNNLAIRKFENSINN